MDRFSPPVLTVVGSIVSTSNSLVTKLDWADRVSYWITTLSSRQDPTSAQSSAGHEEVISNKE